MSGHLHRAVSGSLVEVQWDTVVTDPTVMKREKRVYVSCEGQTIALSHPGETTASEWLKELGADESDLATVQTMVARCWKA